MNIQSLLHNPRLGEIVRFVFVGILATAIHYGVYYVLLPYINENVAYTTGFFVAFICNFFLSSFFTFHIPPTWRRFVRFGGSHLANYFIQIGLFNLFLMVGVPEVWAPLPIYVVAVPASFLLVRLALVKGKKGRKKLTLFLLLTLAVIPSAAHDVFTNRYDMAVLDLMVRLSHNHVNALFTDSQVFRYFFDLTEAGAPNPYQPYDRADKAFMGLTTFKDELPYFNDVKIAKNYLSADELKILNNIVSGYFDFAEIQALCHHPMYIDDYIRQLDNILSSTGQELLMDGGTVSHEEAMEKAVVEYRKFQVKNLSPVEQAYLASIKGIERKAKRKGGGGNEDK